MSLVSGPRENGGGKDGRNLHFKWGSIHFSKDVKEHGLSVTESNGLKKQ